MALEAELRLCSTQHFQRSRNIRVPDFASQVSFRGGLRAAYREYYLSVRRVTARASNIVSVMLASLIVVVLFLASVALKACVGYLLWRKA